MDWGRPRVRLLLIAGMGMLWMAATIARLGYLQLIEYGDYLSRADKQQQRIVNISPRRGAIYDRNMHELAMSVMVDSCFAVPGEVKDPDMAARLISRVLNLSPEEIANRIASEPNFAWVARKITAEQADRIKRMNLKGIYFVKEPKSFFPKGELASGNLGWTDVDEKGEGGIESAYDSQIRGRPGRMMVMTDAHRQWFEGTEQSAKEGAKVVLTIDQNVQFIIEKELAQAIANTHAQKGTVVVEDTTTGELLGVASWPTFNPNAWSDSPAENRKNTAVGAMYEPGSVFKLITVSAAIDQGMTTPDEVIDCQMGMIVVGGRRIHDHKPFGMLSVRDILAKSSDVGAIKLGLRLGGPKFYDYVRAFGMGSQTGVELPGEQRGILTAGDWTQSSISSISMGQEVAVTAMQLVSAMNTIANGGVWVRPKIVRSVGDSAPVTPAKFSESRRVISATTAATMRAMLEGVVLPGGTGKKARLDGYTAAGKTGTAQKEDPDTKRYSTSQYVASFVGFAPINNPAVTILVTLDSPAGPHEGGAVSAPVFKVIAEQVLAYLNVPQDEAPAPHTQRASNSTSSAADDADVSDFDPVQTADSTSVTEMPIAAPKLSSTGSAVTVALDEGDGITVPQLEGKTVREAIVELARLGLSPTLIGSGVALDESPEAGSIVRRGAHVTVRFGRAIPADTKKSGNSHKSNPLRRDGSDGANGEMRL